MRGAVSTQASAGWWAWIDAVAHNSMVKADDKRDIEFAYWLPGVFGLFAIVM